MSPARLQSNESYQLATKFRQDSLGREFFIQPRSSEEHSPDLRCANRKSARKKTGQNPSFLGRCDWTMRKIHLRHKCKLTCQPTMKTRPSF